MGKQSGPLGYLGKKSFHPQRHSNRERVFRAEQERAKYLEEERQRRARVAKEAAEEAHAAAMGKADHSIAFLHGGERVAKRPRPGPDEDEDDEATAAFKRRLARLQGHPADESEPQDDEDVPFVAAEETVVEPERLREGRRPDTHTERKQVTERIREDPMGAVTDPMGDVLPLDYVSRGPSLRPLASEAYRRPRSTQAQYRPSNTESGSTVLRGLPSLRLKPSALSAAVAPLQDAPSLLERAAEASQRGQQDQFLRSLSPTESAQLLRLVESRIASISQ
jgi:hypothetical protein